MTTTFAEAKSWLRERLDDGADCPLCTQHAQVYRRKINSGMARALIEQYRQAGQSLVHTRDYWLPLSKEAAQLQWWGLIAQGDERREDGGQSGWWRVTYDGVAYVHNRLRVPKYARVYDGRLMNLDSTEMVSILDALGNKFDYSDLMAGR